MRRILACLAAAAGLGASVALAAPTASIAAPGPWHHVGLHLHHAITTGTLRTPAVVSVPVATASPTDVAPAKTPLAPSVNPAVAVAGTSTAQVQPLTAWGGIASGFDPGTPPNPSIAVSPSYVIEATNKAMLVLDRADHVKGALTFAALVGAPAGSTVGNPHLVWDPTTKRFFGSLAAYLSGGGTQTYLIVSKTTDPVGGGWWSYPLDTSATDIYDNPSIAVSTDKVVVIFQVYSGGSTYAGPRLDVIAKSATLSGTASYEFGVLDTTYTGLFPVTNGSSQEPVYLVWTKSYEVDVLSLVGGLADLSFETATSALSHPVAAVQNAKSNTGDILVPDNWVDSAMVTGGNLWLAMTEGCTTPFELAAHDCLRYMHLSTSTMQLLEDRSLSRIGVDWYMPSVAVTVGGDMISTFTQSYSGSPPVTMETGKRPSTSTFAHPDAIASPSDGWNSFSSPQRYGNYPATALDPVSPTDVWTVGETTSGSSTPNWMTHVYRQSFYTDEITLTASPATVIYGGTTKLTVKVFRPSGEALGGDYLSFFKRAHGTSLWTWTAAASTDATGTATLTGQAPTVNEDYEASDFAWSAYAGPNHAVLMVGVAPKITRTVAPGTKAPLGTTFKVTGTVAPNHSGQKVTLQRYSSGSWHTVATATLSSTSTYKLTWKPSAKGKYQVRVAKAADADHVAGASTAVTLTVT